jgi:branched-chain amino acid transport system ATP-binding protein
MSFLETRGLSVRYGALGALHDITLTAQAGEITAVIGPNGAGKTTLLKTIAGLLAPAAGTIRFREELIGGLPAYRVVRKGIVLVPEVRGIFGDQRVRDNLMLAAPTAASFRGDLRAVLQRFPALEPRLDELAGALSGGQQQMLALARGLMARPRLLLLDEPSLGLAPKLIRDIFAAIRALRQEGVSILLVEQMAAMALELADRGYVLERGRIVGEGRAADLRADAALMKAYLGVRR